MRYVRLGRTDLEVSAIALGCGNFGGIGSVPELFGQGEDEQAAFALMDAAREHGVTLFDTANSYGGGRSEATIGRWLASRRARDEVVLTTKVRNRVGPGPGDEGLSARHIREQIEASLRRLGTDHVDLYLAHEPDPSVPLEGTMAAFDGLVRAGKVRQVGLSNYGGRQVRAAAEVAAAGGLAAPANLQNSYSPLGRGRLLRRVRRARHRLHRLQPARGRLAHGQVPRRPAVPRRLPHDAAPGPVPRPRAAGHLRGAGRAGAGGRWTRRPDRHAGARVGAHRPGRDRGHRGAAPAGAARAGPGRAGPRPRPGRARHPRRHGRRCDAAVVSAIAFRRSSARGRGAGPWTRVAWAGRSGSPGRCQPSSNRR